MNKTLQVLLSHKETEWYTPSQYIEAARAVMGCIHLDPCSTPQANETVKAWKYFTKEDDGLSKEWFGHVWLNPPYSKTNNKSNQGLWSHKLIEEYISGRVEQAILLVNLASGYSWFKPLYDYPMCLCDHTIKFLRADGEAAGSAKASSCFVYFGPKEELFYQIFSEFGYCGRLSKYSAA